MREDIRHDLNESASDFVHVVWPVVAPLCGGGTLYPIEAARHLGIIVALDNCSGIDAFQMLPSGNMLRGVASRIQYGRLYPTFTLRYKRSNGAATEFEKRLYAIRHVAQGYIYPHLTIQAYMSKPNGQLLAVAVTETSSLYLYAQRYRQDPSRVYEQRNPSDGNSFLVVPWQPYQQAGHPLSTFVREEVTWRSVS
jgi:hypothetical protein